MLLIFKSAENAKTQHNDRVEEELSLKGKLYTDIFSFKAINELKL